MIAKFITKKNKFTEKNIEECTILCSLWHDTPPTNYKGLMPPGLVFLYPWHLVWVAFLSKLHSFQKLLTPYFIHHVVSNYIYNDYACDDTLKVKKCINDSQHFNFNITVNIFTIILLCFSLSLFLSFDLEKQFLGWLLDSKGWFREGVIRTEP